LRICFLVDARSPIACNWIQGFIERGHDAHVISTYPCPKGALAGAAIYETPVAFSSLSRASQPGEKRLAPAESAPASAMSKLKSNSWARLSLAAQHFVLPFELYRHVQEVKRLLGRISPDLVHAMRIPFEGILAAEATAEDLPFLISIWGNDFTLWASRNPIIARQTRQVLKRADALHCDCHRDLNLAIREWGFSPAKPATVLPGGGGIQTSLFYPGEPDVSIKDELNIPDDAPVIINPRGVRGYVRNDVFFQAIPLVLRHHPKAIFLCSSMQGSPMAEKWTSRLGIQKSVRLLPAVSRNRMADMFRLARVAASPSLHDGTPNTLLEAMACGCFPVAGDIESVREWIVDSVNGLLCDTENPESLARAMIRALADDPLREQAREQNLNLIAERAEHNESIRQAEQFYLEIVRHKQHSMKA
jgi:glycosyltransferase involved in cell wall biosynthesis